MSSLLQRDRVRSTTAPLYRIDAEAEDHVIVLKRSSLSSEHAWKEAFGPLRKDSRYYEIVEDTLSNDFEYRYFAIKGPGGQTRAVQPFFVLNQDLLAGVGPAIKAAVSRIRRFWPQFMVMRTLMVGCAAGEAHLPAAANSRRNTAVQPLARDIVRLARQQQASLIVLKEFPSRYRTALTPFLKRGFTRIPSMPMTSLNIAYASFDDYMTRALKSATRKGLRKKFRAAEMSEPIDLEVVADASSAVDDIYPLYLQVFQRSKLQFEKLSKDYLRELGRRMPDKVRFFLWRQNGKLIAFALCMIEGEKLYGEYIGLDYTVALDLHLYHYVMRDVISWGIENGFTSLISSGLNYAPKLQMRHILEPLDLYVRHTSPVANAALKRVLPWLEPTRHDKVLKQFPNFAELWDDQPQTSLHPATSREETSRFTKSERSYKRSTNIPAKRRRLREAERECVGSRPPSQAI